MGTFTPLRPRHFPRQARQVRRERSGFAFVLPPESGAKTGTGTTGAHTVNSVSRTNPDHVWPVDMFDLLTPALSSPSTSATFRSMCWQRMASRPCIPTVSSAAS